MTIEENKTNDFLLLELQNGRESAFDFIFRKYIKVLCAQAHTYVNDFDKAQSLVQDCFIKLWTNRQDAANIKNLSAYLTHMVRNQCIDYIRKTKSLQNLYENANKETTNNNSDELLLRHEFEEKLVEALAALPERSRIAFEYSRFENKKYKEIADKMGISTKAVEALISRALKTLRSELKDFLPLTLLLLYLLDP